MLDLDAYQVLNVPRTATARQITAAYRKAAQAAHPDRGGNTERMSAINTAYQALSDPARRARTDQVLAALNPELDAIKRLVAGKSPAEIRNVLADIRGHIRSFTQRDRWGNFGAPLDDPRLARHKREAAYLESLLA